MGPEVLSLFLYFCDWMDVETISHTGVALCKWAYARGVVGEPGGLPERKHMTRRVLGGSTVLVLGWLAGARGERLATKVYHQHMYAPRRGSNHAQSLTSVNRAIHTSRHITGHDLCFLHSNHFSTTVSVSRSQGVAVSSSSLYVALNNSRRLCLRSLTQVWAIRQAGERARGGTAYVTLEPCNHFGRTPPCTTALLKSGVSRCVVTLSVLIVDTCCGPYCLVPGIETTLKRCAYVLF